MMTSKERAALRAQANPLEVTLIVGKSGISQTLLDEAVILLDSHELVKGRVLETAGLTAREASDMLCEALGAEGMVLDRNDDIERVLSAAMSRGRPVVVDCRIVENEMVLPMIPPGKGMEDMIGSLSELEEN